jgi:hypothetical protein
MIKNFVKNLQKKIQPKKIKKLNFFWLPELHQKTSNTHNFWSIQKIGPKYTKFVPPRSLLWGTSSQKVLKNPKIY